MKNLINKIIVISGPTASGKTKLALEIAKFLVENKINSSPIIINADSIQIFKELPILSAQPSDSEIKQFPHFLYSELNFLQEISVKIWLDLVNPIIKKALDNFSAPVS